MSCDCSFVNRENMKRKTILVLTPVAVILIGAFWVGLLIFQESKKLADFHLVPISDQEDRAYYNDKDSYTIQYVPKKSISPLFGLAKNEFGHKIALIDQELPLDMRTFVVRHELYHLQDNMHKNRLSREINASLAAIPYSPTGFLKTLWKTVTSFKRLKYYFN